ncbi:hypothetical protein RBB50_003063 [Rhinocladiella similis]
MRLDILAFSAVLAGCVSAQSSPSIPSCANTCITDALPASCNLNPSCICTTKSFISSISCCIYNSCDVSDQQAALAYAHSICDPVGGSTLLPASAGCTANSTSSATSGSSGGTAAATTTGSSASAASSSISSALSSASSSASAAASSASAGQSSATSSASAAATTSAAGNAADGRMSVQGVGLGVVGAALLGLAALL